MASRRWWIAALALVAAGCDGEGAGPRTEPLFERYVALGNSITAGFESEGINDSTQANAYPVLLAARAGARFETLRLPRPGCPPPLTGAFLLNPPRVGGGSGFSCAGVAALPTTPIQNLAVPGFRIGDVLTIPGGPVGLLYGQVLGGRTVIQAMQAARPTLVSVWLGNNDALAAATSGDAGRLTPLAQFEGSLASIAAAIRETPARTAAWIGVVDPQTAPVVQPGAYLWLASRDPVLRTAVRKPVEESCAPFRPDGSPNPLAANLVSLLVLTDAGVPSVSCADDARFVLNATERAAVSERVAAFNRAIRTRVEAEGWIYLDPAVLTGNGADPQGIRRCQGFAGAATLAQLQAALAASCPHPDAPNFFGSLISFDAVHPSVAGQRRVADALAAALRSRYPGEI